MRQYGLLAESLSKTRYLEESISLRKTNRLCACYLNHTRIRKYGALMPMSSFRKEC